jgi:hypothetical protein
MKTKEAAVAYFDLYYHHMTARIESKINFKNPNDGDQE